MMSCICFLRRLALLGGVLWVFGVSSAVASELPPEVGRFLVARDGMPDPRFRQSVILLVQHDGEGSGGLVINRPSRLTLQDLFASEPDFAGLQGHLYYGGPVAPKTLLVLAKTAGDLPERSESVIDELYVTGIEQLNAEQPKPAEYRVYTGYAGWGPGQLAAEMARGDWQVLPADVETVFAEEMTSLWRTLHDTRVL